ncbi:alpha/beta fold hydrolase [Marinobacter sp. VGCF2001]|uniref:alpha/beta fold hydrolase n=1 Tax=Marinobacter sp. VGCF2001 TaxID=3417189 RepID=UPI003CF10249
MRRTPLNLFLLMTVVLAVSACSRQSLYDNAIAWERSGAGLEPAQVSIGELDIAYLRSKEPVDGETLVLIHGFGANKDNWTRLAKEFEGQFNIYALDLPGHGDSSKPLNIGYRFENQVRYVHQTMAALGIKRFHMMGNSMGGAITALYAATYPEQVRTAVLFDPAGIMEFESELVERVEAGGNPLIPRQEGDFDRLLDFALEKRPFVPWPIFDVMEEKAIANQAVNEVIFAAIRDAGFEPDFRNAITDIQAPVLVLWGKLDRVIDYRNADVFVEAIPNARKVILDDIGHAPMVEAPARSAALFEAFLAEQHP